MKIAVTYENGLVFEHFGKTRQFKVYEIVEGNIINVQLLNAGEYGHESLATLLKANKVDALICGGMGMGARNALAEARIVVYPGVSGSADEAIDAFLKGELQCNFEECCDHHDHHEGECGHGVCEGHNCCE